MPRQPGRARGALLAAAVVGLTSCGPPLSEGRLGWGATEYQAERRCQQGEARACGDLGQWLVERTDSQRSLERGMLLLELACGRDDLRACTVLARVYGRRRSAGASGHARARDLLTHACDRGWAEACTELQRTNPRHEDPATQRARLPEA